ncbi:MAG TPA: hypothetical protein VLT62_18075 [Candidatus Methylomirabilis sp.]|nr:hypothetical protein [Candidatus Methylomirabilis sp.]HSB78502.1 hypothetical protein [Candidatus Methylomirabilis sp.]
MATIVEYTDSKSPSNEYPDRIVSPLQAGPCCFTDMERVGAPEVEERWRYQYRRCRQCGFTVRAIIQELPDAEAIASLKTTFSGLLKRA